MKQLMIRNETPDDYRIVETVIRNAFWNLYVPGCSEHYLAHIMRSHEDFIPDLDFVAELDGKVVGNVMYTKSKLVSETGEVKQILTFGPVSVLPRFQHQGVGKALLEHSFIKALELGYDAIVILGNPGNYVSLGFKSCKRYCICMEGDIFPAALLVKELKSDVFDGRKWYFQESPVFNIREEDVWKFDKEFEPLEKKYQPSQEAFYIHSSACLPSFSGGLHP